MVDRGHGVALESWKQLKSPRILLHTLTFTKELRVPEAEKPVLPWASPDVAAKDRACLFLNLAVVWLQQPCRHSALWPNGCRMESRQRPIQHIPVAVGLGSQHRTLQGKKPSQADFKHLKKKSLMKANKKVVKTVHSHHRKENSFRKWSPG